MEKEVAVEDPQNQQSPVVCWSTWHHHPRLQQNSSSLSLLSTVYVCNIHLQVSRWSSILEGLVASLEVNTFMTLIIISAIYNNPEQLPPPSARRFNVFSKLSLRRPFPSVLPTHFSGQVEEIVIGSPQAVWLVFCLNMSIVRHYTLKRVDIWMPGVVPTSFCSSQP